MTFQFNVKEGDEIVVHCGYNDFEGILQEIKDNVIALELDKKHIAEIKISEIYAITKAVKK